MKYSINAPDNYQQKCHCVLLLDVSGSMLKENRLDNLNKAVAQFYDDVIHGHRGVSASTKDRLLVEVISFDQSPKRVQPTTLLSSATQPPVLTSRGSTTDTARALDFALDEIEKQKKIFLNTGQKYYRPWLVLVTDGNPTSSTEAIDRIANKIKLQTQQSYLFMTAVGVGNKIRMDMLNRLSAGNGTLLQDFKFADFFSWLSSSISKIYDSDDAFDRKIKSED